MLIWVDPNDRVPDGCCQRFHTTGAPFLISRVRYAATSNHAAPYRVYSRGPAADREPAHGCLVDDSGAGTALLVYGGSWGLLLIPDDGSGDEIVEPYLLIDPGDVVESLP